MNMYISNNIHSSSLKCWSNNRLVSNCWSNTKITTNSRSWPLQREYSLLSSHEVASLWEFEDSCSFFWGQTHDW